MILNATVELECYRCGLTLAVGDEIALGTFGWVHPLCVEDNA